MTRCDMITAMLFVSISATRFSGCDCPNAILVKRIYAIKDWVGTSTLETFIRRDSSSHRTPFRIDDFSTRSQSPKHCGDGRVRAQDTLNWINFLWRSSDIKRIICLTACQIFICQFRLWCAVSPDIRMNLLVIKFVHENIVFCPQASTFIRYFNLPAKIWAF